jgi:hypothetical protein
MLADVGLFVNHKMLYVLSVFDAVSLGPVTTRPLDQRAKALGIRSLRRVDLIFDESAADELRADPLMLDLPVLWCRYGGFNPLPV